MKNYLNSAERKSAFLIIAMRAHLETFLELNEKHMGSNEKKYLKTGLTYLSKWLVELLRRVGSQEGEKIKREARANEIFLKPRGILPTKSDVLIDQEQFFDLADGILFAYCKDCKKQGAKVKECKMRNLMFEHGIPGVGGDPCEYRRETKKDE